MSRLSGLRTWLAALLAATLLCATFATAGASAPDRGTSNRLVDATRQAIRDFEVDAIVEARAGGERLTPRLLKDERILKRVIRYFRYKHGILRGRDAKKNKVTGGTVAAARVNLPGLRKNLFTAGSTLSKGPTGNTIELNLRFPSPQDHGATKNHAEQNLFGDIADARDHGGIDPLAAARIHAHIEARPCNSCIQGSTNEKTPPGSLVQYSKAFPNDEIFATNDQNSDVKVWRGGKQIRWIKGGIAEAGIIAPTSTTATSTGPALDPNLAGVDFTSLELRYISDVSTDRTRAAGFAFKARPANGKRGGDGLRAARLASDAFFVWLALPPSAMWVNLNPSEPDRIIDPQFGRTTAGRILLEADLRMKKTAARLTNPNTRLGRRYWDALEAIAGDKLTCAGARMWIVPAPATVRATATELYIVKAPLKVKLESELFRGSSGVNCGASALYAEQSEAVFRRLILPRVQRAVRRAPQFAALRSVYLSRVAAEWYRRRGQTGGAFADIVGSGDISRWAPKRSWTPRRTFRNYVRSYTNGEYDVKRRTRRGNYIVTHVYQWGGVDFATVPRQNISDGALQAMRPGLPDRISQALTRPVADPESGEVWLAGATFDRAAAADDPVFTGEQPGGGLGRVALVSTIVIVLLLLTLAAARWGLPRLRTAQAGPVAERPAPMPSHARPYEAVSQTSGLTASEPAARPHAAVGQTSGLPANEHPPPRDALHQVRGLAASETFTSMVTPDAVVKRMIPMLVLLFLISALFFSMVVSALGAPGIVGLILAVPFSALMLASKKRQLEQKGRPTLTLSSAGAVMSDGHMRVDLPWTHVRSIGQVDLLRAIRTPTTSLLDGIGSAVVRATHDTLQGTRAEGLVGCGRVTLGPGAPRLLKIQVKQFLGDGPADPLIGQRPMGIPLVAFETDWQHGRIGEWVRAHRPDLLG